MSATGWTVVICVGLVVVGIVALAVVGAVKEVAVVRAGGTPRGRRPSTVKTPGTTSAPHAEAAVRDAPLCCSRSVVTDGSHHSLACADAFRGRTTGTGST